jgi:hypothetical protein
VELYLHSPNTPSWHGAQFKKKAREQLYLYLTELHMCIIRSKYTFCASIAHEAKPELIPFICISITGLLHLLSLPVLAGTITVLLTTVIQMAASTIWKPD